MEVKVPIFKRVSPGDRWMHVNEDVMTVTIIHPSLTQALESHYQKTGGKQYYIDAGEGRVYAIDSAPDPEPLKFSIYGDY